MYHAFRRYFLKSGIFLIVVLIIFIKFNSNRTRTDDDFEIRYVIKPMKSNRTNKPSVLNFDEKLPIINVDGISKSEPIFIGGLEKSGMGLLRAILDVHPAISCGPDAELLPNIVEYLKSILVRIYWCWRTRTSGRI